jgi:hypothetical protein
VVRRLWSGAFLAIAAFSVVGMPAPAVAKSSGISAKSVSEILAATKAAVAGSPNVRMRGLVEKSGKRIGLDLVSAHGTGGGTISQNGLTFTIVVRPPTVYLKADAQTWNSLTHTTAAGELFAGKWLKTTTSDADFASMAKLLDTAQLMNTTPQDGPLTKGRVVSYHGIRAITIESAKSTAYVAATGKPYLLGLVGKNDSQGEIRFTDYGTARAPTPPKHALDIDELKRETGTS